jgi:hypothetical protein
MFHGEKGGRVVIADSAGPGMVPPEIYLYPPEGREYEASAEDGGPGCRVLDHELEATGDYRVLVYRSAREDKTDYRLCLAKMPRECSYVITPDDPDGDLIKSDCVLKEKTDLLWNIAGIFGAFAIVPWGVTSAFITAAGSAGAVEGTLMKGEREFAQEVVLPEAVREEVAAREDQEGHEEVSW